MHVPQLNTAPLLISNHANIGYAMLPPTEQPRSQFTKALTALFFPKPDKHPPYNNLKALDCPQSHAGGATLQTMTMLQLLHFN